VKAGSKLIRYVSFVRQVWLENVIRVNFHTVKKVIVCGVEQIGDGRDVVAAVGDPFGASQQLNQDAIGRQPNTYRPCWCRVRPTEASRSLWRGIRRVVMRLACRAHAAPASRTASWYSTTAERLRGQQLSALTTTPRIRRLVTRSMSGRGGGRTVFGLAVNTSSLVLTRFSVRHAL